MFFSKDMIQNLTLPGKLKYHVSLLAHWLLSMVFWHCLWYVFAVVTPFHYYLWSLTYSCALLRQFTFSWTHLWRRAEWVNLFSTFLSNLLNCDCAGLVRWWKFSRNCEYCFPPYFREALIHELAERARSFNSHVFLLLTLLSTSNLTNLSEVIARRILEWRFMDSNFMVKEEIWFGPLSTEGNIWTKNPDIDFQRISFQMDSKISLKVINSFLWANIY